MDEVLFREQMDILNKDMRERCEMNVYKRRESLKLPEGELEFVYGCGVARTGVMLIGEAPGKDEVIKGEPFVGKAGAILSELLDGTDFKRGDIYITNVIKYRLARTGKRAGTLANRPATSYEITNGVLWLIGEILLVRPRLILTLGNVPLKAMRHIEEYFKAAQTDGKLTDPQKAHYEEALGKCEIGQCHGQLYRCDFKNFTAAHIPLYHPASLIYNRKLRSVYNEDMEGVKKCISSILS